MIRIVIDTNVLVAALRSNRGASFALLDLIGTSSDFTIQLSVPLILEYESVLKRHHAETGLNDDDVDEVVDYLCSVGDRHSIFFLWRPVLRDPKDDFVLELAVRSESELIVTFNTKDFVQSTRFGITAVTPSEFLSMIRRRK
jgi:putative PIN family toxin of toxin-antitoxin system